jgi:hypothetical protein
VLTGEPEGAAIGIVGDGFELPEEIWDEPHWLGRESFGGGFTFWELPLVEAAVGAGGQTCAIRREGRAGAEAVIRGPLPHSLVARKAHHAHFFEEDGLVLVFSALIRPSERFHRGGKGVEHGAAILRLAHHMEAA